MDIINRLSVSFCVALPLLMFANRNRCHVLTLSSTKPHILLTHRYDGGIAVWNLSTGRSRRLASRERMERDAPPTPDKLQEYVVFDIAVIESRVGCKDPHVAELIASTATGVYVWCTKAISSGRVGACAAHFWACGADGAPAEARSITVWEGDKTAEPASRTARLVIGDSTGRITVFDITGYCAGAGVGVDSSTTMSSSESPGVGVHGSVNHGAPSVLWSWQAHCQSAITSFVLRASTDVERDTASTRSCRRQGRSASSTANRKRLGQRLTSGNGGGSNAHKDGPTQRNDGGDVARSELSRAGAFLIMSCSEDCRARLWTHTGSFIGTFGQDGLWDVRDEDSWQAPGIPHDIKEHNERQIELALAEETFEKHLTSPVKRRPAPAWGIEEGVSSSSESGEDDDDAQPNSDTSSDEATATSAGGCGDGDAKATVIAVQGGDAVFDTKAFPLDETVVKGEWGHISRMKYIGDGGAESLYARHRLDADRPPQSLTSSTAAAPGGTAVTAQVPSAPPTVSRSRTSKDYIEAGLPRKVGNNERRHRAQERDWSDSERTEQSACATKHAPSSWADSGGRNGFERPGTNSSVPTASDLDRTRSHSYRGWALEEMDPVVDIPRPKTAQAAVARAKDKRRSSLSAESEAHRPSSAPVRRAATEKRSNGSSSQGGVIPADATTPSLTRARAGQSAASESRPRSAGLRTKDGCNAGGAGEGTGEIPKAGEYRYGGASTRFAWAPVRS
jgi:hypothetical protein